jgi:2-polyprenyl-3-methyl-5-hydroxy-6-metoxy-1,4-benzoquinol methylase
MKDNKMKNTLSTDKIINAAINMIKLKHNLFPAEHLDIGSGGGNLILELRKKYDVKSSACDYTSELMELDDITVSVANLNFEKLPFPDQSFDIVTITEVVEHLEHFRETLAETFRVLKPGGTCVVTTPNILSLKSRIRFLIFGFYNLFGPLHFKESNLHSAGGHITPISLFYLVHALVDAGYTDFDVAIDKRQGTSLFWLIFLWIPIKIFGSIIEWKEINKFKTIDSSNFRYVRMINSLDILLGRTIVVGCKKLK